MTASIIFLWVIAIQMMLLLSIAVAAFAALSSPNKCTILTGAPRTSFPLTTTKSNNTPRSITKRSNHRRTAFVLREAAAMRDYGYTSSSSTSTTLSEDGDIYMSDNNPIKSAGLSFLSASTKSLGMLFYNIGGLDHKDVQALLLRAGSHLVHAGEHWSTDWSAVRESMFLASQSFYDISNVFGSANIDESLPLGTLFENISRELRDISNISGCCSVVGPPCSVPNLLAIQEHLIGVSLILKKNSVAATDEHMMATLFREVAELFGKMAGCYVDDVEGQTSEVTL